MKSSLPVLQEHFLVPKKVIFSQNETGTWWVSGDEPLTISRRRRSGDEYKRALEEFIKIRDRRGIERFVKKYGMPRQREKLEDSYPLDEDFFYGMAFTLSWVQELINCLVAMQEDVHFEPGSLKVVSVSLPGPQRFNAWIDSPEAKPVLKETLPNHSDFSFLKGLFEYPDKRIQRIRSLVSTDFQAFVVCPTTEFLSKFGPTPRLINSETVVKSWEEFSVPKLKAHRDKTRFYIEETLALYFSNESEWLNLLSVHASIAVRLLKTGQPPNLELRMDTLLDGMIHALLCKWQETKYKRCMRPACPNLFTFKRNSKKFCSEACEKRHGREMKRDSQ